LTVTVCFCGALSLTRGRVCLLYMLLVLASAVFLGSESLGSRDHIVGPFSWYFDCRHGPHREHLFQKFLNCCMGTLLSDGSGIVLCVRSCCIAAGAFTEPIPSNGCFCWFQNSGFQQTCRNVQTANICSENVAKVSHLGTTVTNQNVINVQRFWVRFPTLPDFLRSSGSGTGSTQPREDNWGATWIEK
jgi:hypothetical protein